MSRPLSDAVLRRVAIAMFVASIAMSVTAIALNAGVNGRPGLPADYSPLDVELIGVGVVVVSVALLLCWARPRNSVGWLLALSGVLGGTCNLGQVYGTRAIVGPGAGLPLGTYALALSAPLWIPALLIPGTSLLARYPSGRITGRWARRFDRAFAVGLFGLLVVYATSDNAVTDNVTGHANPLHVPSAAVLAIAVPAAILAVTGLVGIIIGAIVRMFHAGYPERQQLAWLFTTALAAAAVVFFAPVQELGTAAYAMVPVAIAVGVLRYRLLGLEVVVRRALVYGALTGAVLLVFVAVTAGLATVVPRGPFPQLIAASVVAVGVVPVRDRLQRAVDRLVYGDRRDPWTALQRLSTPMGAAADDVVSAVVAAIATALRAPGAAVFVASGDNERTVPDAADVVLACHGELSGVPTRLPLRYAGADLGVLAVAPRPGETALGRADVRLLETLAPLVAAVVHAERLTGDLRLARARLLTATAAERSRLQHELHDGLGPALTGVGLGLEAVESRIDGDARATEMVARLRAEVSAALEEVRRIIEDLRPAVFDDVDLVTALRRRCKQLTASGALTVELTAPTTLPPLPPEYETAIYRIAEEALTNVVRHASASRCTVTLEVDDGVRLLVADDGVGFTEAAAAAAAGRCGVGLVSMRERAERLGGSLAIEHRVSGIAITVHLPTVKLPGALVAVPT